MENIAFDSGIFVILPSSSYFTLASGGYIMRMRPMAIGMEVVPTLRELMASTTPGKSTPTAMPSAMAAKIQMVK